MAHSETTAVTTAFSFDLNAKITQKSDHDLLSALEEYAKTVDYRYFKISEFDKWANRPCHSCTITQRFGSWKKALSIIGIDRTPESNRPSITR